MRIAIGSDHRGFALKHQLVGLLQHLGHEVLDAGTNSEGSCDYPDFAGAVARQVGGGEADRGMLICGTGIGMSIAANKVPGVRAGLCHDEQTAEISRRHNDLNVLCLSGDLLGEQSIEPMVKVWLETEFEGGRHQRRVEKIKQLEEECGGSP